MIRCKGESMHEKVSEALLKVHKVSFKTLSMMYVCINTYTHTNIHSPLFKFYIKIMKDFIIMKDKNGLYDLSTFLEIVLYMHFNVDCN